MMTIDEVGEYFNGLTYSLMQALMVLIVSPLVPVNLKESDAFHLTIEEYLLALTSLVEELVSLPFSCSLEFTFR